MGGMEIFLEPHITVFVLGGFQLQKLDAWENIL